MVLGENLGLEEFLPFFGLKRYEKRWFYAGGSATVVHTSVVTRARVNMATQPGIREGAYYFKVRFACASNNQSQRCVTPDKPVKK